ncbi:uncharacterized protein Z518_02823 [Rhinocladiella mackenziei CBS 650.93]|uniref:GPI anchored cell wall protein n=1 Tax=Rhinocladiella mackenziei CBS 650.93 TaxID=1442369 RepID=A0A0D2G0W7_9EURO|nr:uncharacterized protein Z518_02823 [Rhinocladiella mackenziei CBS 650.93]KIX08167.1 hypothetical protein Z518_02823 [Rhinocladiella mackenziei CBS 650.93]
MKASLILPVFAFTVRVLADVPPACLLNAVNTQDEPGDLSAICGDDAIDVQEAIASMCGDNQSVAQSAFLSTCSAAGSSVAPYTATSTSESQTTGASSGTFVYTTAVYNSDCDCTTTIVTSASSGAAASTGIVTATSGGSASATNTAGGSSATDNAAVDAKQVGSFAAAVIAIAGVVAVL